MNYIRKFKKENLRIVYLVVTQRCNLSCPFCIRGSADESSDTLKLEDIRRYINDIKSLNPNATLVITGGEATLHPAFREILRLATDTFSNVVLCSNGTILTPIMENIDLLLKCRMQISIDGSEPHHNKIRGEGSYQKSKRTIEYLVSQKARVSVSSTLSRENISSIEEMFNDMYRSGVRAFKFSQEMPGGYAEFREEEQLSCEEWNTFCDIFRKKASSCDAALLMKKAFPFVNCQLNMKGVSDEMLSKAGCKAGITQLYIYPDQKVYGCPMLKEYPLLDLTRHDLCELEKQYSKCALYDYSVNSCSVCSRCDYKEICRGGCPGRRVDINSLWSGDKTCPIVRRDIF